MSTLPDMPREVDQALHDWYAGRATEQELRLASKELPAWLEANARDIPEGSYMHYQMAANGIRNDLLNLTNSHVIAEEERRVEEALKEEAQRSRESRNGRG